jgi:hypothetical protein
VRDAVRRALPPDSKKEAQDPVVRVPRPGRQQELQRGTAGTAQPGSVDMLDPLVALTMVASRMRGASCAALCQAVRFARDRARGPVRARVPASARVGAP